MNSKLSLTRDATWLLIRQRVCAVRLPPLEVKGKAQPDIFYSIRVVLSVSYRIDTVPGKHFFSRT